MKTIEIIIASDGTTRIETRGFSGATCQAASRFLEQALGRPTAEALTTEFHQVEIAPAAAQQQTGDGRGH